MGLSFIYGTGERAGVSQLSVSEVSLFPRNECRKRRGENNHETYGMTALIRYI